MNFQLNNLMLKRENKERGGEGEKEREREKEKEKGFLESCEKRGRTFLRLGSFLVWNFIFCIFCIFCIFLDFFCIIFFCF